jgi:hypothetical protein
VGIGISTQTVNYNYSIKAASADANTVINLGNRNTDKKTLKSYIGLNFTDLGGQNQTTEVLALSKVCETVTPDDNIQTVTDTTKTCDGVSAGKYKDLGAK